MDFELETQEGLAHMVRDLNRDWLGGFVSDEEYIIALAIAGELEGRRVA